MGGKSLMYNTKKLLIIFIAVLPLWAELSVKNIEHMVQDIKSKRVGKIKDYNITSSPFVVVQTEDNSSARVSMAIPETKAVFSLGAIVNKSAFIDGSWHKAGDVLNDFRVDTVSDDHVVLKKKNRTITLFFKKVKNMLKISKEK
jgi:hypothetical protein